MRNLVVTIVLAALAGPALADEPLIKSRAKPEPPLVPSAYSTATQPRGPEEPAAAEEVEEETASVESAPLAAPAAPAPAPVPAPSAEVEEDGPQVLFSGDVDHGAYGGLVAKTSQIMGETALLVGGRAAWLIDHRLALGIAGYGLASDVRTFDAADGRNKYVEMAYGGFHASYVLLPDSVVHLSLDGLVGAGGTTYSRRYHGWNDELDGDDVSGDAFFVGEVGANVVLNLARFARVSVGPSWRFTEGVRYRKLRDDDFSGPGATATIDFGKF